jgi:hypothetical protein
MQVNIFLDVSGQEAIAKGESISYWSYSVRQVEGDDWLTAGPKGSKRIAGPVELFLPDKTDCVQEVIADLRVRQARIYAEAAREVAELKQREEQLLALTYSTPSAVEVS